MEIIVVLQISTNFNHFGIMLINTQSITAFMSIEDILKKPVEERIALIFDYDLTMTEDWQQAPYLRANFEAIKKAYDGKKIRNPATGKLDAVHIEKPGDYFRLSDAWAEPHNGVGYVGQMILDAKMGILQNFNKKGLMAAGAKVALSPGLPEFLKLLKKEWKGKCDVRFFIVSVGLEDLIAGSSIAQSGLIEEIYATKLACINDFWEDTKNGTYDSIREIVTPFVKTSHAIEIAKGGRNNLNKIMKHQDYLYDYRNILVFGDGTSDISQFAYLRRKGSRIVCVYKRDSTEAFDNIRTNKLIQDRCNAIKPRDYTKGSDLWNYINQAITSMLNRKCKFDPELIDMHRKKKIRNKEIQADVSQHLSKCPYCNTLSALDISVPEPKEEQ